MESIAITEALNRSRLIETTGSWDVLQGWGAYHCQDGWITMHRHSPHLLIVDGWHWYAQWGNKDIMFYIAQ